MIEYSALGIPPAYVNLIVEIEETHRYTSRDVIETRTATAYFDPALSEFHDSYGCVRGNVLRWKVQVEA